MPHYVGLDAGKNTTSICIVDEDGAVFAEGEVPTEPADIIAFLRGRRLRFRRVGLEAMGLAPWLYEDLAKPGLPIVCIDPRHAHGILKAKLNKTDRNDARGIAEIMRVGVYRAVHVKTSASQEARALLGARKLLINKRKDVDNMIRGLLLQFGLKVPRFRVKTFERTVRGLVGKNKKLLTVVDALLDVRRVIEARARALEQVATATANADPVCCHLMTAPGVGALVALTYRAAVDVPERFTHSRTVGVHFGLTPRTKQSGELLRRGRISKCGDESVRTALFLAARTLLSKVKRHSLETQG